MPPACSLDVLCEDGPVLAVNKPAGLLTQGVPQGLPTLEGLVRDYVKEKYEKPGNVYLGIPHRLDRPTSGVVVFARNSKSAARLSEQFHDRQVKKEYLAVVESVPPEPEGTLTDWLLKDAERSHVQRAEPQTAGAKPAALRYRILDQSDGRALLLVEPQTGRMHQIRVQLSVRGWPIVGDVQYGAATAFPSEAAKPGDVIALHARRLTILHPIRYTPLSIDAPVPTAWSAFGMRGL